MTDEDSAQADWVQWHLDTTGVRDKADLMDRLAEAFDLPSWFGRNWDALADCLSDKHPRPGVVITWWGTADLPDELRRPLEEILAERAEAAGTPWRVLRLED